MRFLALAVGVHTIDNLTLKDIETGESINLRCVVRHVCANRCLFGLDLSWTLRSFRAIDMRSLPYLYGYLNCVLLTCTNSTIFTTYKSLSLRLIEVRCPNRGWQASIYLSQAKRQTQTEARIARARHEHAAWPCLRRCSPSLANDFFLVRNGRFH